MNAFSYGAAITSMTDVGLSYSAYVEKSSWAMLPTLLFEQKPAPARDGLYSAGSRYGARSFSFNLIIAPPDGTSVQTNLDALMALIDGAQGDGYVKFDRIPDRAFKGRFQGGASCEFLGNDAVRLGLNFACSESMAYSLTETEQTLTITTNPQTDTVPASGALAGTARTQPVYVVKNTSGGAANISVKCVDTDQQIDVNNVANSAWVKIDASTKRVYYSTDSGVTWADANTKIGTNAWFPELAGGAANSLTTSGLSAGSVVITYRGRYL